MAYATVRNVDYEKGIHLVVKPENTGVMPDPHQRIRVGVNGTSRLFEYTPNGNPRVLNLDLVGRLNGETNDYTGLRIGDQVIVGEPEFGDKLIGSKTPLLYVSTTPQAHQEVYKLIRQKLGPQRHKGQVMAIYDARNLDDLTVIEESLRLDDTTPNFHCLALTNKGIFIQDRGGTWRQNGEISSAYDLLRNEIALEDFFSYETEGGGVSALDEDVQILVVGDKASVIGEEVIEFPEEGTEPLDGIVNLLIWEGYWLGSHLHYKVEPE